MIELVIDQRRRRISSFEVGRVLPFAKRRMVGPFIFFDHMGPVDLPQGLAREADVLPHPHIGLSTVTYLFAGEIVHRDSTGFEQVIRPGEMNWMIAGSGITHSERFERARREGGPMHAIQSWLALPAGEEETAPAFAHHEGDDLPVHRDTGVSPSRERIAQAKADWRAGRMKLPDLDNAEFVPLPPDPLPSAPSMS
jgi:redox-sensitive bicupin YhaK (pirin superfamily)